MTRHTQPIVERLFRPMERSTRQRSSIRTVMEEAGRPLLPAEILGAAQREVPAIGLATVYRSEEHTSELQSPDHLVCRLLLEKKKQHNCHTTRRIPPSPLRPVHVRPL